MLLLIGGVRVLLVYINIRFASLRNVIRSVLIATVKRSRRQIFVGQEWRLHDVGVLILAVR